jgi:hypothetical protein
LGYLDKTRRKSAVTSIKLVGNVIYGVSNFPTDRRLSFRFFKYGLVVEVLNQIASCFAFLAQERERIGWTQPGNGCRAEAVAKSGAVRRLAFTFPFRAWQWRAGATSFAVGFA